MIILVILIIIATLAMCGVFNSKDVKEADKRWNDHERRLKKYAKGLIPDKDMAWWEKMEVTYSRIARHRYEKGYDIDNEYQILSNIISTNIDDIFQTYKDGKLEDYGTRYNRNFICMAIGEVLTYIFNHWQEDTLSFFEKYHKAIIIADKTDDVVKKLHIEHDLHNVKRVYLRCVEIMKDGFIKDRYLEKLKAIEHQEQVCKHQRLEREKEEEKRKHIERIESMGGLAHVNTGDDYEHFVMFCVKDAGYVCKIVGRSGDYGADLVAEVNGKLLVIQCKFYSTPVGYDAVQQVYAAKSVYKGTWCCVVSNASFTRQAIVGSRKLGVRLLSHADIAEYLRSLK